MDTQYRHRTVGGTLGAAIVLGALSFAGVAISLTTQTRTISVDVGATRQAVTPGCPPSQGLISGGFAGEYGASPDGAFVFPLASRPSGGDRWFASAHNYEQAGEEGALSVFAYCSDSPASKERSTSVTVGAEKTVRASATCPRGTRVVSGGFAGNRDVLAYRSRRTGDREWTAWGVSGKDGAGSTWEVFALCRDGGNLETRRKSRTVTASAEAAPKLIARCRRGERVVSGGFLAKPVDSFATGPEIVSSHVVGTRRWLVEFGIFDLTAKLTAFAYCR